MADVITELNTFKNARCLRDITVIDAGPRNPANIKALNLAPIEPMLQDGGGKVRFDDNAVIIELNAASGQPALSPHRPSILRNVSSV